MSLRTRLALSHLAVLGVFALIFIVIVVIMTRGSRGPMSSRDRIFETLESVSTPEQLQKKIRGLRLSNEMDVVLHYPDGRSENLGGTAHVGRTESFVETVPLKGHGLEGAVLEIRNFRHPGGRPRAGSLWNPLRDLLIAALCAGLAGVGLSMATSRFVLEPLAELSNAVEGFEGHPQTEQLQASGPPEIRDLAESFNSMAERLSANMEELRLRKEEAERSEASRRQFLGEVSHNLRTPLAAILGWTDTLLDDLAKGQETNYLKRIRRETRYVSSTIGRLLDLSRWERARPILHVETFALSDAILETAENLEEAAAEKNIELDLNLPESSCWVDADRHRVRDLFQILLENVVEHAGEGVRVEVSVRLADDRYWVSVTDNGRGLPDSLITGWTGDPLVAATGRASLGLAIANHLARAHGGELRLSSGPEGQGTRASFTLPLAPISEKLRAQGMEMVRLTPSESGNPPPAL